MPSPTSASASTSLRQLAEAVLGKALRAGATDAEAVVYEGEEFSAHVRLGEVETLTESGSRAIGLRVFLGARGEAQRVASTSSSDLSADSLDRLVSGAIELARISGEDPFAGLPEESAFGEVPGGAAAQHLFFGDVQAMPPAERIEVARRVEAAALATDTRIGNSKGGSFDLATSHKVLSNSRGFTGEYRRSSCGFSASPIALDQHGGMQGGYWYSSARSARLLEDPEEIGRIAAHRALRHLGARKVRTQQAPVVFSPEIARGLIGNIFSAAEGDAIYRNASIFNGMLGERVAGENITVVDDGTLVFDRALPPPNLSTGAPPHTLPSAEAPPRTVISTEGAERRSGETPVFAPAQPIGETPVSVRVGGFGTAPFDGEGLPTRRTVIVDRGILRSYVTNTYTGRKLGIPSTGNASRGLAGNPGTGSGNFFLQPGEMTPEEIIAGVPNGLYVTDVMGFGVNLVTGDYSQGASGLWIENGELAFPVEEITIAGNLKDIYRNITAVGNDLHFRGSGAVPTLRVEGMMIAGA